MVKKSFLYDRKMKNTYFLFYLCGCSACTDVYAPVTEMPVGVKEHVNSLGTIDMIVSCYVGSRNGTLFLHKAAHALKY